MKIQIQLSIDLPRIRVATGPSEIEKCKIFKQSIGLKVELRQYVHSFKYNTERYKKDALEYFSFQMKVSI